MGMGDKIKEIADKLSSLASELASCAGMDSEEESSEEGASPEAGYDEPKIKMAAAAIRKGLSK